MPFDIEKQIGQLVITLWRVATELDDLKDQLEGLKHATPAPPAEGTPAPPAV